MAIEWLSIKELPAIKIGGRGVWRVDRAKLEAHVDRLHEETAVWTKANPLGGDEIEGGD